MIECWPTCEEPDPYAASSLTADEVLAVASLVATAARGGDVGMLALEVFEEYIERELARDNLRERETRKRGER